CLPRGCRWTGHTRAHRLTRGRACLADARQPLLWPVHRGNRRTSSLPDCERPGHWTRVLAHGRRIEGHAVRAQGQPTYRWRGPMSAREILTRLFRDDFVAYKSEAAAQATADAVLAALREAGYKLAG